MVRTRNTERIAEGIKLLAIRRPAIGQRGNGGLQDKQVGSDERHSQAPPDPSPRHPIDLQSAPTSL
jgi:hypothetical protein